jgi:hypothetical protein
MDATGKQPAETPTLTSTDRTDLCDSYSAATGYFTEFTEQGTYCSVYLATSHSVAGPEAAIRSDGLRAHM